MPLHHLKAALDSLLSSTTPSIARILDLALGKKDISVDQASELFDASGADVPVIVAAADHLRKETVGDVVIATGENLDKNNVAELTLTDPKSEFKAEVTEQ